MSQPAEDLPEYIIEYLLDLLEPAEAVDILIKVIFRLDRIYRKRGKTLEDLITLIGQDLREMEAEADAHTH